MTVRGGRGFFILAKESTLPADGWPRISRRGIEILQAGMNGDFSEWYESPGNHPMIFPPEELRNGQIRADPKDMNFVGCVWHGIQSPHIGNLFLATNYRFNRFEYNNLKHEDANYIRLRGEYWYEGMCILIGDAFLNDPHKVKYADMGAPAPVDDEDEEECDCTVSRPKCRTLESFL